MTSRALPCLLLVYIKIFYLQVAVLAFTTTAAPGYFRVVSGGLFNESWVELDEEIRALELRGGIFAQE